MQHLFLSEMRHIDQITDQNNIDHYYHSYSYYYSPINVKNMEIVNSDASINGQADNLNVSRKSVVKITGADAYARYRCASLPHIPTSGLNESFGDNTNHKQAEITLSTDESPNDFYQNH